MILNKKEIDFIEMLKCHQEDVFNREYFSLEKFVKDQKVLDELFKDSMDLKNETSKFLKSICSKEYTYKSDTRVKCDVVMLTTVFMIYKNDVEGKIAYLVAKNFSQAAQEVQENFQNDYKTFSEIIEKMLGIKI